MNLNEGESNISRRTHASKTSWLVLSMQPTTFLFLNTHRHNVEIEKYVNIILSLRLYQRSTNEKERKNIVAYNNIRSCNSQYIKKREIKAGEFLLGNVFCNFQNFHFGNLIQLVNEFFVRNGLRNIFLSVRMYLHTLKITKTLFTESYKIILTAHFRFDSMNSCRSRRKK